MNNLNKQIGISEKKWVDGDLFYSDFPEYSNANGDFFKNLLTNPFINQLGAFQKQKEQQKEIERLKNEAAAATAAAEAAMASAASQSSEKKGASVGLSKGMKIGLIFGAVLIAGTITFFIVRAIRKK